MKQIILLIIAVFISISGFSQNGIGNSTNWNNSLFKENPSSLELKIYPNPCKSNKITLDFNSLEIAEVQLTNITGKQVFLKKFQYPEAKKQIQFNNIQNGMYLIKVKSADNKIVVKKFIMAKE
ncbi:MAG: T9SS type A sorting domain-containing protein [Bacteroidetes bacterium]|nr:T9SS type A sorting domain-containing protein [Bacteroidota bacterium]